MDGKQRLLVIDDDAHFCAVLGVVLTRAGYAFDRADDGRTGLVRARDGLPDLILLDTGLPGTSGWYTLARLRELATLAETPVIVMTSADDAGARTLAHGLGADACLAKPFATAALLERIGAALGPAAEGN